MIGVRTDRAGGDILADVVILADGVNSTLARKAGFRREIEPRHMALAVKEIHFLPKETIESRFNIHKSEGVVIEMLGKITQGMMGTGFLYTNGDSVSIGVGWLIVGDSGRFVNAVHREGSNLAMTTRRIAAETVPEMRHLPHHLQHPLQPGVGIPARGLRHPVQIRLRRGG